MRKPTSLITHPRAHRALRWWRPWPVAAIDPPSPLAPQREGERTGPARRWGSATPPRPLLRRPANLLRARARQHASRLGSFLTVWAVTSLLIFAGFVVAAAVLAAAVRLVGWQVVNAFAAGAATTLVAVKVRHWGSTRHLREYIHWLGEDLEARKAADLAEAQAQVRLEGRLP